MRPRQPRRSRQFWQELCDSYQHSSMTQDRFARRHGVNCATFRNWLYKLRREAREAEMSAPAFVELTTSAETPRERPEAVRSSLVVTVGARLTLDFHTLPSPAYLAALVHAIDEVPSC